jgi:hypothetical protein
LEGGRRRDSGVPRADAGVPRDSRTTSHEPPASECLLERLCCAATSCAERVDQQRPRPREGRIPSAFSPQALRTHSRLSPCTSQQGARAQNRLLAHVVPLALAPTTTTIHHCSMPNLTLVLQTDAARPNSPSTPGVHRRWHRPCAVTNTSTPGSVLPLQHSDGLPTQKTQGSLDKCAAESPSAEQATVWPTLPS